MAGTEKIYPVGITQYFLVGMDGMDGMGWDGWMGGGTSTNFALTNVLNTKFQSDFSQLCPFQSDFSQLYHFQK